MGVILKYLKFLTIIFLIILFSNICFAKEEEQIDYTKLDPGFAIGVKYSVNLFYTHSSAEGINDSVLNPLNIGFTIKSYINKVFGFTIDFMCVQKYGDEEEYGAKRAMYLDVPITFDINLGSLFFISSGINISFLLDGFEQEYLVFKDSYISFPIKLGAYLSNTIIFDFGINIGLEGIMDRQGYPGDTDKYYQMSDYKEFSLNFGVSLLFGASYEDRGCVNMAISNSNDKVKKK